MDLFQRIEELLVTTAAAAKEAAERGDFEVLEALSRRGRHLNELSERLAKIKQEVQSFNEVGATEPVWKVPSLAFESNKTNAQVAQSGPRHLIIEVTQGMINQNLLTLTDHVKAGRIRPGLELKIEARPSGELFCTDLLSEGNRLRERGAIARFYRDAKVRTGDKVVLAQQSSNRWTLEKFGQTSVSQMVHSSNDQI